jgi:hypothetical protein
LRQFSFDARAEVMQIDFQFYWENARTNMNRVMKLKPSVGCRGLLAAFIATLASVAQLFAADPAVSITWSNPSDITYGTALGADQLNAVFTNEDTGESVTGTAVYVPASGAFLVAGDDQVLSVTFTPNGDQGVAVANYTKTVSLSVSKAELSASIPNQTSVYGAATGAMVTAIEDDGADDVVYTGFVAGDDADTAISNIGAVALETTATAASGIGSAVISFDVAPSANNYNITTNPGTLTITKKALVVGGGDHDAETVYGATPLLLASDTLDPALAGNASGWENDDELKVTLTRVHGVTSASSVGDYDINLILGEKPANLGVLKNYSITFNSGVYTVEKRALNITTAKSFAENVVYGGVHPVVTASWAISEAAGDWDLTEVKSGDDATIAVAGVLTTGASLNPPAADAGVGAYVVTASGAESYGGNFTINYDAGETITVTPAPLTLTALDRTKISGAAWPVLKYTYDSEELQFGDSLETAVTLGDPVLTFDALVVGAGDGTDAAVGEYEDAIVFNAVTSDNYNVTLVKADLNVTLTPVTLVWSPAATTLTYGEGWTADHLNAEATTTIDGAVIAGTMAYKIGDAATDVGGTPGAGSITVTATFTPADGPDDLYSANSINYTFSVAKAVLTVTADDDATRVYADDPKVYDNTDYTIAGFVLGDDIDDLETQPSISDPTSSASNVGNYVLSVGGGADDNYSFTYVSGSLTITAKPTALTWDAPADVAAAETVAITYGTSLVASGNNTAVGPADLAGTVVYSIAEDSDYALTFPSTRVSATFVPDSSNYSTSPAVELSLAVNQLEVDVIPDGVSVVFGDEIPSLTGSTEFLPDDGIVASFETAATSSSDVGDYFITVNYEDSNGRLANYDVNLISDNRVSIIAAPIAVEVLNGSSVVNDSDLNTVEEVNAVLQIRFTGLKAEAAVLNGVALTAAQVADLIDGTSITFNAGTDDEITYQNAADGEFAGMGLLKRVLTGAPAPVLSVHADYSNGTSADFAATITFGEGALDSNYSLSESDNTAGIFSVGKGTPTIAWAPAVDSIVYGSAIGADQLNATVTDAPLLDGDGNSQGTFTYTYGGSAAAGQVLEAGTHTLHVAYSPDAEDASAYIGSSATVDITVTKAPLTVTIANMTHIYGDPLPRIDAADATRVNVEGWVGTDGIEVFLPSNGGRQPVVAISPENAEDGYIAGSTANLTFGQEGAAANYDITHVPGTMPISRRELTVKPSDVSVVYGTSAELSVEYINLAPGETSANLGATAFAYTSGNTDVEDKAPGVYTIYSDGAFGDNYWVTHTTGTLTVTEATGTITISGNEQTFDGTGKSVTVGTSGVGGEAFAVTITYDGSADLPVDAGTYSVSVESNSPNYDATATGSLVISPATATIVISDLTAKYNGSGHEASVAVTPDVSYSITYNGGADAPVNAGDHAVNVTVTDANYQGSADATLVISKAKAYAIVSDSMKIEDGTPQSVTVTTIPEGLGYEVSYTQNKTAANIAFVSFHETDSGSSDANGAGLNEAADKGYTDALTAAGHNVTRILTSGSPDVDALSDYDLVIISRSVSSGGYSSGANADNWNSVTTPTIQLGGYVLRTSRMGYTQGTTMVDTTGNIQLKAEVADHPIFDGIELTDGVTGDYAGIVTWNDTVQRGVSVNTNDAGDGATVIATVATEDDPTAGGIIAMEYAAGAATTTGGTFAGKRLVLLTGSREASGVTSQTAGLYDLTETGKAIFLNAVGYMAGVPADVAVTPIEAGAYKANVTIVDDNYAGSATGVLAILPAASIEISDLRAIYDGTAQEATVKVVPVGLNYSVTYNKSPNLPKAVGAYDVEVTINDSLYSGSKSARLTIYKGQAEVAFDAESLLHPWTNPVAPSVSTTPAGLATLITYNGLPALPSEPGDYEVVATVVDANYAGSGSATYTLGKGAQSISFPAVPNLTINGNPIVLLLNAVAFDSNGVETGLPIQYTLVSGAATIEDNLLTISQPGRVVVTAQQLGNQIYAAAEEKVRSFNVTGTGVPLGAAQTVAKLNDDGSIGISTQGQPFQELSVYASSDVDGSYDPVVKLMLDENGKGTFNANTEEAQRFFQVK